MVIDIYKLKANKDKYGTDAVYNFHMPDDDGIIPPSRDVIELYNKLKFNDDTDLLNMDKALVKLHMYCKTVRRISYFPMWAFGPGHNLRQATYIYNDIYERRSRIVSNHIKERRRVLHAIGDFKDSLSPSLVQNLLTWMKNTHWNYSDDIVEIPRGRKEEIISNLEEIGYAINTKLLCDFFDGVDKPMRFTKEFNVSNHKNGKKMTNLEIRKCLKGAVKNREMSYRKSITLASNIRSMPNNVEELIRDFVV